jgi:hypothetical protein
LDAEEFFVHGGGSEKNGNANRKTAFITAWLQAATLQFAQQSGAFFGGEVAFFDPAEDFGAAIELAGGSDGVSPEGFDQFVETFADGGITDAQDLLDLANVAARGQEDFGEVLVLGGKQGEAGCLKLALDGQAALGALEAGDAEPGGAGRAVGNWCRVFGHNGLLV